MGIKVDATDVTDDQIYRFVFDYVDEDHFVFVDYRTGLVEIRRVGYSAAVIPVPNEFQRGANAMLRICREPSPSEKKI